VLAAVAPVRLLVRERGWVVGVEDTPPLLTPPTARDEEGTEEPGEARPLADGRRVCVAVEGAAVEEAVEVVVTLRRGAVVVLEELEVGGGWRLADMPPRKEGVLLIDDLRKSRKTGKARGGESGLSLKRDLGEGVKPSSCWMQEDWDRLRLVI
jgi:hypothetical protein